MGSQRGSGMVLVVCSWIVSACPNDHAADSGAVDGGGTVDGSASDELAVKFDRLAGAIVDNSRLNCECAGHEECSGGEDPRQVPAWRQCILDVAARDPALFSAYFDCGSEQYDLKNACLERCETQDTLPCDRLGDEESKNCPKPPEALQDAITACKKMFYRPPL